MKRSNIFRSKTYGIGFRGVAYAHMPWDYAGVQDPKDAAGRAALIDRNRATKPATKKTRKKSGVALAATMAAVVASGAVGLSSDNLQA